MRIYLDAHDLIRIAERGTDAEWHEFCSWFEDGGHTLILSLTVILELCVPLTMRNTSAAVSRMLTRIDGVRHLYIAEARITRDELRAAIDGFAHDQEPAEIEPYTDLLIETMAPFRARDELERFPHLGLPERILELWQHDPSLFSIDEGARRRLAASRDLDRTRADLTQHRENFANTIRREITQYGLAFPVEEVTQLADWIWSDHRRAPSVRLSYEVFHRILRNRRDRAGDGDIGDLTHLSCRPYVDAMTADRRMLDYLQQADRALHTTYSNGTDRNIARLKKQLAGVDHGPA